MKITKNGVGSEVGIGVGIGIGVESGVGSAVDGIRIGRISRISFFSDSASASVTYDLVKTG